MNKGSPNKNERWRKIPKIEYYKAEAFLKLREKYCVTASSRFLRMNPPLDPKGEAPLKEARGHVWYLGNSKDEINALLLHCGHSLFPVFTSPEAGGFGLSPGGRIPGLRFLNRFLGKVHIHAVQGLREDAELLESLMREQGYFASERIDYDLMSIDAPQQGRIVQAGSKFPNGLVLRTPKNEDRESLYALQAAYEQEEVLPENAVFNADASRLNLEHILLREHILVAELNGQVVGKINTSAESFTRYQIGGVFVRPDCRDRGIGAKMTEVFVHGLLQTGKGISLFVKKRNVAARTIYRKAGFSVLADYRISYY